LRHFKGFPWFHDGAPSQFTIGIKWDDVLRAEVDVVDRYHTRVVIPVGPTVMATIKCDDGKAALPVSAFPPGQSSQTE